MANNLGLTVKPVTETCPAEEKRVAEWINSVEYKEKNFPNASPDAWVLPGKRGRPIDTGTLMFKYIKPLAREAGIPELHWHALRHLNNSLMLNEGVDVKTRMDRLGHTTDRVNIIYSHAGDQAQLAASEAVWQRLKAAESQVQQQQRTAT